MFAIIIGALLFIVSGAALILSAIALENDKQEFRDKHPRYQCNITAYLLVFDECSSYSCAYNIYCTYELQGESANVHMMRGEDAALLQQYSNYICPIGTSADCYIDHGQITAIRPLHTDNEGLLAALVLAIFGLLLSIACGCDAWINSRVTDKREFVQLDVITTAG